MICEIKKGAPSLVTDMFTSIKHVLAWQFRYTSSSYNLLYLLNLISFYRKDRISD